jgi:hypothetical protein
MGERVPFPFFFLKGERVPSHSFSSKGRESRFCVRERVASCKRRRRKRDTGEPGREGGRGHRHRHRHRQKHRHTHTETDTDTDTDTDPGVNAIVAAIQRSKTKKNAGFSHEGGRGADKRTQQRGRLCFAFGLRV